jgi:hypothetical protein
VGFGSQVFQEQGIHRPFQADMKFADQAIRQCDQLHAAELEFLVQTGHVLLITRKSIKALSDDDVEVPQARFSKQLLVAWTKAGGTTLGMVAVCFNDPPPFPFSSLPTNPQLIFDRGLALEV